MSNGDGLADGFGAAEHTRMNGSLHPTAPPQSTSSPVNSQTQEDSQGVAAYQPMMLEKSEGTTAVVTVHTGDALQSLRLSMPMQETELCKHKRMWSESPPSKPSLHFSVGCFGFWDRANIIFNSLVCIIWTDGFSGNVF